MISILIPVYDFTITELIKTIHYQCIKSNIVFEIIAIDDDSKIEYKEQNRTIQTLQHVYYEELTNNQGRVKLRNLMAQKARYQNLLFIDCDAQVTSPDFILNYCAKCTNNAPIIACGGTAYSNVKPHRSRRLRWKYGKIAEERPAEQRTKDPNMSFSAFNFLISKDLFNAIQFDTLHNSYGHEDTLFGIRLSQNNICVKHIDNALIHCGLDTNEVFFDKTTASVENLYLMFRENPTLFNKTKLVQTFTTLDKANITTLFSQLFSFKKNILKQLIIRTNSVFLLNLYKLAYFCYLSKHQK